MSLVPLRRRIALRQNLGDGAAVLSGDSGFYIVPLHRPYVRAHSHGYGRRRYPEQWHRGCVMQLGGALETMEKCVRQAAVADAP